MTISYKLLNYTYWKGQEKKKNNQPLVVGVLSDRGHLELFEKFGKTAVEEKLLTVEPKVVDLGLPFDDALLEDLDVVFLDLDDEDKELEVLQRTAKREIVVYGVGSERQFFRNGGVVHLSSSLGRSQKVEAILREENGIERGVRYKSDLVRLIGRDSKGRRSR